MLSANQILALAGKKKAYKKRKSFAAEQPVSGSGGPSELTLPRARVASPVWPSPSSTVMSPAREGVVSSARSAEKALRCSLAQVDIPDDGAAGEVFMPKWNVFRDDTFYPCTDEDRFMGKDVVKGMCSLPRDVGALDDLNGPQSVDNLCNWFCQVIAHVFFYFFFSFFFV